MLKEVLCAFLSLSVPPPPSQHRKEPIRTTNATLLEAVAVLLLRKLGVSGTSA